MHTGDWHLGKNLEGQSRMDEQEMFLDDFVQIVEKNNVDLVIIAGDIYDGPNPPARAERMFYHTLKNISKQGERLVLVIAGNHDNPERLVAAGPLAMEHGIIMMGTPKTIVPVGQYGQYEVVDSGEGYFTIEVNGEKAVIVAIPYPSEKRLNEVIYQDTDEDELKRASYGERMNQLFRQLEQQYREDTINIMVSHLFVMGSEESGSERCIQLGGSYLIDSSIFPEKAQYIALGHVHKPQIVPGTNHRGRYSGSPLHYNKSEISYQKKLLLADLTVGESQIQEIDIPVYKPIEVWKCHGVEEAIELCEEKKDIECWVYLEIVTDTFIREDEIKIMKELKKDILSITPIATPMEEQREQHRSFLERSFEDIFKEFYQKERGVDVTEETLQVLLSIVKGDE